MYRLLDLAGPEQAGEVRQFLAKPPEIRSRRLASNRGVTFAGAFAVATPLLAADGSLIAAISAATDDPAEADSLDDPGEELKKAIATPGPRYGLGRAEQAVQRAEHPARNPDQPGGSGRLPERGTQEP
jgi:IclR family acetate operon transcriptional repressor